MMEEIKEMNEIYYKIYKKDNKLNVVCMQWFDEFDYNEENFIKSNNGEDLKFSNEDEANKYLETLNNQPDYKSAWNELKNKTNEELKQATWAGAGLNDTKISIEELETKYNLGGE